MITVFTDVQWAALRHMMGDPVWAFRPEFDTLLGRKRNEDELERLIGEWTRTQTAETLVERLQGVGVPAGVVQTAQDVLERDPHLLARGYYVYLDHPEAGHNAYDGPHFRLNETPGVLRSPAPLLGQHNDYVLNELLGVPDETVAELLVGQVVF